MLNRKAVFLAAAFALSGATMSQAAAPDLPSTLFDNYVNLPLNQRALAEQAQNHAANQWFRMQRLASANSGAAHQGVISSSARNG